MGTALSILSIRGVRRCVGEQFTEGLVHHWQSAVHLIWIKAIAVGDGTVPCEMGIRRPETQDHGSGNFYARHRTDQCQR